MAVSLPPCATGRCSIPAARSIWSRRRSKPSFATLSKPLVRRRRRFGCCQGNKTRPSREAGLQSRPIAQARAVPGIESEPIGRFADHPDHPARGGRTEERAQEMETALRFCMVVGQRATWPEMLARAQETEALGFDGLFLVDHFYGLVDIADPTHEAYTMLAALAPFTHRLRLGV